MSQQLRIGQKQTTPSASEKHVFSLPLTDINPLTESLVMTYKQTVVYYDLKKKTLVWSDSDLY